LVGALFARPGHKNPRSSCGRQIPAADLFRFAAAKEQFAPRPFLKFRHFRLRRVNEPEEGTEDAVVELLEAGVTKEPAYPET